MRRIVFDISGHGLGHLAQIAPLIRLLRQRVDGARIIIRSRHARGVVAEFAGAPFTSAPPPPDPELVMLSPVRVDAERTLAAYVALHEDYSAVVAREAAKLAALKADVLISDIGYTGLAAAAEAGITAYALCSLHWEETLAVYLPGNGQTRAIRKQILDSYNSARAFFLTAPRRHIGGLVNVRPIAPLVRGTGRDRSAAIRRLAGVGPKVKLGLISFGGIAGEAAKVRIPDDPDWLWIVRDGLPLAGASGNAAPLSALGGMDMLDLYASCDLVLTKTGYGTFTECAASGAPCLYLPRPDWPEARDLETWMRAKGYGLPVSAGLLASGAWKDQASRLRRRPAGKGIFRGAEEAAEMILADLDW